MIPKPIHIDRQFEDVKTLWQALLDLVTDEHEFCPFAEHEDLWLNEFRQRWCSDSEGIRWEVLQISRSIDGFLVNLAVGDVDCDTVAFLRELLNRTRPQDCVCVGVFDPLISGDSIHLGTFVVFGNHTWGTAGLLTHSDAATV
jgi:hypothetical protein